MPAPHPLIAELRRIRVSRGVSRSLLAAWLGVAVITVQAWESGRRQPRDLSDLERWAAMLGHTLTLTPQAKEQAA